jgi:O-acetyl-ADP-ribose deacetylase (regulator of RNase III)
MIILNGDLLKTPFEIIAHQVNCQGKMGSGVAKWIRKKFPWAYEGYMAALEQNGADYMLGKSQVIWQNGHTIFNIFGQYNYGYDGKQYTNYKALDSAFRKAILHYRDNDVDDIKQIPIAIPYKIGCGYGGGDWDTVKEILEKIEEDCHVIFVAYKLEG